MPRWHKQTPDTGNFDDFSLEPRRKNNHAARQGRREVKDVKRETRREEGRRHQDRDERDS
jgi:hypothetical protein